MVFQQHLLAPYLQAEREHEAQAERLARTARNAVPHCRDMVFGVIPVERRCDPAPACSAQ